MIHTILTIQKFSNCPLNIFQYRQNVSLFKFNNLSSKTIQNFSDKILILLLMQNNNIILKICMFSLTDSKA